MVDETGSLGHRNAEHRNAEHGTGNPTFRIQPQPVSVYAEVLRGQAMRLARIETELGSTTIDEAWLGHLPEATHLIRELEGWRDTELALMAEVAQALGLAGEQLTGNIATYTEADSTVADAFSHIASVGRRGW